MPAPAKLDLIPPELRAWLREALEARGFAEIVAVTEELNLRLQDWSPVTLAHYEKSKDRPGPRLLTGPSKALSTTISYEAEADEVSWGSNMIYAAVMQLGAQQGEFGARMGLNKKGRRYFFPIPWGPIPARPYLGLGTADQQAIGKIIAKYLGEAAGQA